MITAAVLFAGVTVLSGACVERPHQQAQAPRSPATLVAEIDGQPITLEELEKNAGGQLLSLSIERHRILEATLDRMIAAKVLALEAKATGQLEARLIQQNVLAKTAEVPTEAEVDAYLADRPGLAGQDRAKSAPQARQALLNERRQKAYRDYIARLKQKYGVKTLLEPLRAQVDEGGGPAPGPPHAPVTIVEFSDFECPFCRTLARNLAEVMKQYGNRVRRVFRQYPLESIHRNAMAAAKASVCAADQGRFWEMHGLLFEGGPLAEANLLEKAAKAGLEAGPFKACLASTAAEERVRADLEAATALGVSSTPTFFVNGRPMLGAIPTAEIARVIEEELGRSK